MGRNKETGGGGKIGGKNGEIRGRDGKTGKGEIWKFVFHISCFY